MNYLQKENNIKKVGEGIEDNFDFQKRCNELAELYKDDEEKAKQITEAEKAKIIKERLEAKGIFEGHSHCTFKNFKASDENDINALNSLNRLKVNLCETILFLGNTGNGKTHLAISAVRSTQNSFYTNSKKMLIDYRSVFQEKIGSEKEKLNKYISFNLLVIDEVDRISATDAERDFLFLIIEERQARRKATILISNKSLLELTVWIADNALMRRLTSNAQIFQFNKKGYIK